METFVFSKNREQTTLIKYIVKLLINLKRFKCKDQSLNRSLHLTSHKKYIKEMLKIIALNTLKKYLIKSISH